MELYVCHLFHLVEIRFSSLGKPIIQRINVPALHLISCQ